MIRKSPFQLEPYLLAPFSSDFSQLAGNNYFLNIILKYYSQYNNSTSFSFIQEYIHIDFPHFLYTAAKRGDAGILKFLVNES